MLNNIQPYLSKIIIIAGAILCSMDLVYAQEDTTQYSIKIFDTRHAQEITDLNLKAWQMLLKLKTYIDYHELPEFKNNCDTIRKTSNVKMQDSTVLTLKSGLSWILEDGPPKQPKHFHWKLLSKKGKQQPGMQDRIRYLQFITRCEELDDLAYDMIREMNMYYSFKNTENEPCMKVYYTFQPDEKNKFDLINREVKVY